MRKNVYGRKLSRDKNERKALFKGLLSSLVMNGRIKTTHGKAKAIKPDADKLITKARKDGALAKSLLERDLLPDAVEKVRKDIAPRFSGRNGGYTRIVKLGRRFSDKASTALLEWVEGESSFAKAAEGQGKAEEKEEKIKTKTAKATSSKSLAKKKRAKPKKE